MARHFLILCTQFSNVRTAGKRHPTSKKNQRTYKMRRKNTQMKKIYIFSMLILWTVMMANAQSGQKSNRGKEFWLGYGFNAFFFVGNPANTQELALFISTGADPATVTVSVNNTGWTRTVNIPANSADATILIPKTGADDARITTDGLNTKGIHIVSDVPIAVYAHQYSTLFSAATMLMPVETYGFTYYSINYDQTRSQSNPDNWYSWFFVTASEDNTKVEITPSDTTKNGWLPGLTYTITLKKGETYSVFGKGVFNTSASLASKDMTGSKIVSVEGTDGKCHPIGLFSGSGGLRLCPGDGGEYVHQQVFPANAWGTRYLTYHTINNSSTNFTETNRNYYRVCVQDPSTVVKRNNVTLTGLQRNFFYEFVDSTGGDYITADKPIMVAQFTPNKNQCWNFDPNGYGDPEMFYLSPIEQGQKNVTFFVSRRQNIDFVYTNIHVPLNAAASLRLDGAPIPPANIIPHPNFPSYAVAFARIPGAAAPHTLTCDSSFTATVYGLGVFESYGYNVGTLVNNLNANASFKNKFSPGNTNDTVTCPKSPIRLTATLAFPATRIEWQLSKSGGSTPATDVVETNPTPSNTIQVNGRTLYQYTLNTDVSFALTGTYRIPILYAANALDACNKTETFFLDVLVKQGPRADFNFANANCTTDTVQFTGTPILNGFTIASHLWTFPDNTNANTINTKKRFSSSGTQTVQYTIVSTIGCAHDTTKTITIQPSPLAKFGLTTPICSGDSTRLTDSSTVSQGTITNWYWDFGNGNTANASTNAPIFQTYNNPGFYTIKMVASSDKGCKSDTAFGNLTVIAKPQAKFGVSGNICVGDSVRITDSSSAPVGAITQWLWDFGDGNTAVRTNNSPFFHKYSNSGSYTIQLRVVSSNGCTSLPFPRTISVVSQATASISLSGAPCVDSTLRFTSSIPFNSSTPPRYYWQFGDGQVANVNTANTVSHTYAAGATNLVVKHMVSFGAGCNTDTATLTIAAIYPNPTASYTVVGDTLCEGKSVLFQGSGSSDVTNWLWNFGNGTGTQAPPFSRVYSTAGSFTTSLIVRNAAGCGSRPSSQILNIRPTPMVDAGPNKSIKKGESVLIDATVSNSVNYSVQWTPSTDLSSATILKPTASPSVSTTYTLRIVDNQSLCTASDTMRVQVFTKLFIPNAFSPNGDGNNDQWILPGISLYPDALVQIYNRWGQKIYETKNYADQPWTGFVQGKLQSDGVYVYVIQLNNTEKEMLKGTFLLLK